MGEARVLAPEELVSEILRKLQAKPHSSTWHEYKLAPDPSEPAAYTIIVGAGFSYGVVPLTAELMRETIGDYYIPDQDGAFGQRPPKALRKHSASFWAEFNEASKQAGLPLVELDREHLPVEPGEAYHPLFAYEGANALFRKKGERPGDGKRFVKGFLRYALSRHFASGGPATGSAHLHDY